MLGTDSVLLREWSSDFQVTLQDQYNILEEVVAKRSSFPTMLLLLILSTEYCSNIECSCLNDLCVSPDNCLSSRDTNS